MPTILHAADLHLDSPFSGLSPEQAMERRREQRELLQRLAELVRAHGVQLVLLAGDLFDRPDYHADTAQALCRALAQMAVPVFIAPGNHDPAPLYKALDLPSNVTVFDSEEISSCHIPALNCTVHGRGFVENGCVTPLGEQDFRVPEDGGTHILLMHGEIEGQNLRFGPIFPKKLAETKVHYAALGHIHQALGPEKTDTVTWAYPGCPEGRGFDELGDKGVLIGSVEPDSVDLIFVPTAKRRYHLAEVRLEPDDDPAQALLDALPEGCEQDAVRVLFTGERDAALDLAALTALAEQHCWCASVLDHTALRRDPNERLGEDSLTGCFLRALQGHQGEPGYDLALRFGMAALEHGEDPRP